MKNLPKVPTIGLSKEQQEIFKQFPNDVAEWKEFLQKLGLTVVSLDTYDYPEGYDEDLCISYNYDQAFQAGFTLGTAIEKNLIITAAGFVTAVQFAENRYWPDCFGNKTPPYLQVDFYPGDKAEITLCGDNERGTSLCKMLKDDDTFFFPGTWNETANVLIKIQKEIADNLKIEKIK